MNEADQQVGELSEGAPPWWKPKGFWWYALALASLIILVLGPTIIGHAYVKSIAQETEADFDFLREPWPSVEIEGLRKRVFELGPACAVASSPESRIVAHGNLAMACSELARIESAHALQRDASYRRMQKALPRIEFAFKMAFGVMALGSLTFLAALIRACIIDWQDLMADARRAIGWVARGYRRTRGPR